jgi:DNA invertase Pin-like site-specific DNA recombinase
MQLDELRAYCQRRGWTITETFLDEGISGSKPSRPALDKLMKSAKRRAFDVVLVYRYDRFARSLKQLVDTLCTFDALGIQFVSIHEGVDTSTPNGRLVFGIFASIAEFERDLIRARTRSGMQAAKARGKHIGRPTLNVDCTKVADLRLAGHSKRAIAKVLNVSEGTVRACVKRLSETSVVTPAFPQSIPANAVA